MTPKPAWAYTVEKIRETTTGDDLRKLIYVLYDYSFGIAFTSFYEKEVAVGALIEDYAAGRISAALKAGYAEGLERAALIHEDVNPASDSERLNGSPGAGAMGAVIEYRDKIRGLAATAREKEIA